jgi:hypothetical protein
LRALEKRVQVAAAFSEGACMNFRLSTAIFALALAATPAVTLAQAASPSGANMQPVPGGMSLRALAMMERVSDPRLSPDGRTVLYAVRSTDWEGNRVAGRRMERPSTSCRLAAVRARSGGRTPTACRLSS